MSKLHAYRRFHPGTQPEYDFPPYASTAKRHPTQPLVLAPQTLSEITGPVFGHDDLKSTDNDLTRQHKGEPIGERIIVSGRVLDENGKPVPHTLVEVWQANAAGRYPHKADRHDAPIDPNFSGAGRTLSDADGRYRFITIRPGEYPWRNHYNAWRPAHIHFSLFGQAFLTRLVTQMYFPGDPLLDYDPMYMSIPDAKARLRLVSQFDWEHTVPEHALAYRFDIVLRGREATPMDDSPGE
ncbi:MAG: protocatechuate 3,4-dioxygenase subunit beta [Betaproteobacteria bacterium]|nr:protocatechuate 3,4-dioxygenase subunit beta [Betaproteobacteria bacterium]